MKIGTDKEMVDPPQRKWTEPCFAGSEVRKSALRIRQSVTELLINLCAGIRIQVAAEDHGSMAFGMSQPPRSQKFIHLLLSFHRR